MKYAFTEIFDIPVLTRICEGFTRMTGSTTALLSLDGHVHIATGWQPVCMQFHRVNPGTAQRCTESDTILAGQLKEGNQYNVYQCKNGLVDVAAPIRVRGEHMANFFIGQFLFQAPDTDYFHQQARQFGLDEPAYFEALSQVPIISREEVKRRMAFLVELTEVIAQMGVSKLDALMFEEKYRAELEKQVQDRTRELQRNVQELNTLQEKLSEQLDSREALNSELRRAKERADASNRAKSEFLANMSHEIRTPLNTIMGMGELLLEETQSTQCRDHLMVMHSAGEALMSLINDILDLSKIEAGQLALEQCAFDLYELGVTTLKIFQFKSEQERVVALDFYYDPELPQFVVGDRQRIRQVLINLLGNARKFTRSGGVWMGLSAVADERVLFEVVDTGIGIAVDKMERIFRPFEQADNSVARQYGGTGLGLSISRRLVEALGGMLRAESEEGRGSVFSFSIPLRAATHQEVEGLQREFVEQGGGLVSEQSAPPQPQGSPQRGRRVLVVDDSADNRKLISAFLARTQHVLDLAANGQEALNMWADNRYDIIFMDVQMPVMDGLTAVQEIRRMERDRNRAPTPIVALTAHAMQEDERKSLAAGCDFHMTKPVKKNLLLEVIQLHGV
ncbi:PocR ligand-binding domain-containing protein [Magnetofaba australis]|uniref:Sensory/regulatory protein RpfC n=1 Tax=Magnetofaba australis IT-1 TaxID=1434232 RepID=A0A1Y2K143_9PROT|nr:PocR ligand-binding domain-containing protein [Magnetofaba australis]OSM00011.1 putative histidine kinase [Magnetofaba australis IT-1]